MTLDKTELYSDKTQLDKFEASRDFGVVEVKDNSRVDLNKLKMELDAVSLIQYLCNDGEITYKKFGYFLENDDFSSCEMLHLGYINLESLQNILEDTSQDITKASPKILIFSEFNKEPKFLENLKKLIEELEGPWRANRSDYKDPSIEVLQLLYNEYYKHKYNQKEEKVDLDLSAKKELTRDGVGDFYNDFIRVVPNFPNETITLKTLFSICFMESEFVPDAKSPTGAKGLFQLTDSAIDQVKLDMEAGLFKDNRYLNRLLSGKYKDALSNNQVVKNNPMLNQIFGMYYLRHLYNKNTANDLKKLNNNQHKVIIDDDMSSKPNQNIVYNKGEAKNKEKRFLFPKDRIIFEKGKEGRIDREHLFNILIEYDRLSEFHKNGDGYLEFQAKIKSLCTYLYNEAHDGNYDPSLKFKIYRDFNGDNAQVKRGEFTEIAGHKYYFAFACLLLEKYADRGLVE